MIACPACRAELSVAAVAGDPTSCPRCARPLQTYVFPTLTRGRNDAVPERVAAENEASCYDHETNRATTACDRCGRYLCSLCDFEIGEHHFCTVCLEDGETTDLLLRERTLWGRIVMRLALLPLLIFYFTLITAPIAVFLGIRHRKAPGSLVHERRWVRPLAVFFAALQVGGWAALFLGLAWFGVREGLGG